MSVPYFQQLNEALAGADAGEILAHTIQRAFPGEVAAVSSFGAESAALLALVAEVDRSTPVFFIDTYKHFDETYDYLKELKRFLGLTHVEMVRPAADDLRVQDPDGLLYESDPDRCCEIRKTRPLMQALRPYKAWITGRKRFQTADRQQMTVFEQQGQWTKVNPLADWTAERIQRFIEDNALPSHPLVADGYPSIGCENCTSRVCGVGADLRSGRWKSSDKTECGIHFVDGKIVRGGLA